MNAPPRQGRAVRIASPLYRVGDWITDAFLIAHRTVPLFGQLHASLPSRDGIYKMTAGGYTRLAASVVRAAATIDQFLEVELTPAHIVEQAPAQMLDIDNAREVVAYDEPWYVEHDGGLLVFDGAAADPVATYRNFPGHPPVDTWWLTAPGAITTAPALVGTVAGERRFLLTHGMKQVPDGGSDG